MIILYAIFLSCYSIFNLTNAAPIQKITSTSIPNSNSSSISNQLHFTAIVINLSKDVGRMAKLKPLLDHLKISYTLFEAVDGAAIRRFGAIKKEKFLTEAELEKQNPHLDPEIKYDINDRKHKVGEIGCWLSHLQVLLNISRSNATGPILILEDDAQFTPDFLPTTLSILKQLPSNWDSLRVGFCPHKSYSICKSPTGQIIPNTNFCKVHQVISGAHAYLVNGHLAARKIFDQLNSVTGLIVDLDMKPHKGIEQYISQMKLVKQDHSFKSNLQNPRC